MTNYKTDWSNDKNNLFFLSVCLTKGSEKNTLPRNEVGCNGTEKSKCPEPIRKESLGQNKNSFGFFHLLVVPFYLKVLVNLILLVL